MAEARMLHDWQRTGMLCSLIANANRDRKKRKEPFSPEDFIPPGLLGKKKKAEPIPASIDVLKVLLP